MNLDGKSLSTNAVQQEQMNDFRNEKNDSY